MQALTAVMVILVCPTKQNHQARHGKAKQQTKKPVPADPVE